MEIIIRTEHSETVVHSTSAGQVSTPPPEVAETASATGALNAGPAPSGPDAAYAPPVNIGMNTAVTPDALDTSAGAAPPL